VLAPGAGVVVPPSTTSSGLLNSAIISSKSARASENDRIDGLAAPAFFVTLDPVAVSPRVAELRAIAEAEDGVVCKPLPSGGDKALDGVACPSSSPAPEPDCPADIAAPFSVTLGPEQPLLLFVLELPSLFAVLEQKLDRERGEV
jgi:hypothetical protein